MAYFGEEMDLDPYEGDDYFLNLGLYGDQSGYYSLGQQALSSLPGILRGIYARARELSSNAGGYEDDEDFIYRGPIYQTSDGTIQMQGPMHTTPVLLDQEVGGGGAPRRPTSTTSTPARPTTPTPSIYDIEGGGGGQRPITLPGGRTILVPENLNPLQLLTQGLITREIYKQETGEDAPDITQTNQVAEPVESVQETGDPLRRTTDPDPVDPITPDPVDPIIPDPVDPTPDPVDPVDPDPVIPDPIDMSDPVDPVVTDPGNGIDPGNNSNNGTDPGPSDGNGGEGFDYDKFFEGLSKLYPAIPAGASFEEGTVPRIIPTALSYGPEVKDYAQLIDAINREISPKQAETATNLYSQITEATREAQSPLMKSLARRSEMQGLEAERLMGPLSFLEGRDATQAGYGQAVSGGRGLGNISEMLAGRQRAEQKNVNLQLASNLLGQQRATAGLMADIESGIYGQIAPEIGVDPGQVLGITGMDIGNILGERQGTRAAEAIASGAERQLYAQAMPYAGQAVQFGYDMIRNLLNRDKPVYAETANV
jgi:hypothetical protein